MRLSEVLNLPEFKTREIVLIGTYTTGDGEFALLAHRGEKVLPIPKLFHLVELKVDPSDPESDPRDPNIHPSEIRSILARFHYFEVHIKILFKMRRCLEPLSIETKSQNKNTKVIHTLALLARTFFAKID